MSREITLIDLVVAIIRKMGKIVIVAIIFALIIAGIGSFDVMQKYINGPEDLTEDEIISLELTKAKQANLIEYEKESIYLHLDSFTNYEKTISFYINAEGDNGFEKISEFMNLSKNILSKTDLMQELSQILGKEVKEKYIRELVSVTSEINSYNNSCMINIYSIYNSQEIADGLADETFNYIKELVHSNNTLNEQYSISTIKQNSRQRTDNGIYAHKSNIYAEIAGLNQSIKDYSNKTQPISLWDLLKSIIKYFILGGFIGIFIMLCFIIIDFSCNEKLYSLYDLEKRYKFNLNEDLSANTKNNFIDKIISVFQGYQTISSSREDRIKLFNISLNELLKDKLSSTTLCFTGIEVQQKTLEKIVSQITSNQKIKDIKISANPNENSEDLKSVLDSDVVILVCEKAISRVTVLNRLISKIEKLDKEIAGIILVDVC